MKRILITLITFLVFQLILPKTALAGSVTSVKGKQAVLDIVGESFSVDQQVYLVDDNGKKVALVKVKQIRGNKALVELLKGKLNVGNTTMAKPDSSATADSSGAGEEQTAEAPRRTKRTAKTESSSSKKTRIGGLVGFANSTMTLTAQYLSGTLRSEDVSLKGSSFNIKGYFDYDFSPLFTIRGISGLETFNTSGETTSANICGEGTTKSCTVNFNYISFEGHAQLNYLKGSTRAWVGLGYAFYYTMSKSINIPNLSATGATNQAVLVGTGADIGLSGGSYIPVILEYAYIPGDNVKSSALFVRGGYGWNF